MIGHRLEQDPPWTKHRVPGNVRSFPILGQPQDLSRHRIASVLAYACVRYCEGGLACRVAAVTVLVSGGVAGTTVTGTGKCGRQHPAGYVDDALMLTLGI